MGASDRTTSSANGPPDFKSFLQEHLTKHKHGLHTKEELSTIRALLEADAAHADRICPKGDLPPEVLSRYNASKFNDYRAQFIIDEHGTLLKKRTVKGVKSEHPIIPVEEVEGVIAHAHSVLTPHHKTEPVSIQVHAAPLQIASIVPFSAAFVCTITARPHTNDTRCLAADLQEVSDLFCGPPGPLPWCGGHQCSGGGCIHQEVLPDLRR